MEKKCAAVDRFLVATETIEMVKQSLFDLSERGVKEDLPGRLSTIAFVLSNAQEVLNEFKEDVHNDNVLIFNPNN